MIKAYNRMWCHLCSQAGTFRNCILQWKSVPQGLNFQPKFSKELRNHESNLLPSFSLNWIRKFIAPWTWYPRSNEIFSVLHVASHVQHERDAGRIVGSGLRFDMVFIVGPACGQHPSGVCNFDFINGKMIGWSRASIYAQTILIRRCGMRRGGTRRRWDMSSCLPVCWQSVLVQLKLHKKYCHPCIISFYIYLLDHAICWLGGFANNFTCSILRWSWF